MGFPVGYSELPKLLLDLLLLLAHLREFINSVFRCLGLSSLLDSEARGSGPTDDDGHENHRPHHLQDLCAVAADQLIRESSPAVQFSDLLVAEGVSDERRGLPETCVVCLCEFEGSQEVRRMSGCRHVFHRRCVDRWLEHGQRTCPMCRAEVVADDGAAAPEGVVDGESSASPVHTAAPSGWTSSNPFLLAAMEG